MDDKQTIGDALVKAVRSASTWNKDVQVRPACVLWPDRDRQWEAVIPRLKNEMPGLLVLGDFSPEQRMGPAIWLRCVLARRVEEVDLPQDDVPIIYLPGVGRQDLRAVETCPDYLKPLAELQYRGEFWAQINAKDWTILAFLKSDQGGLGLDVAQDNEAKTAMQLALHRLLDEDVSLLRGKRLDKDYFNTLLSGGDPVRDLLQWLDQDEAFRQSRSENEWKAFVEVCKSQMAFNPQNEGILAGASKLASREGPWKAVWERFCEAPKRYPNIPEQIRKCQVPAFDLFADVESAGGWPQWNASQEETLRHDLLALSQVPPHEARKKILEMEKRHGRRRELVWAEFGEADLSRALAFLAALAETTTNGLSAGKVEDLKAGYMTQGWRADDSVLSSLSVISKGEDLKAVSTAIRSVYLPWAEESARYLQKEWIKSPSRKDARKLAGKNEAQCVVFVDGLRFDCAKRLVGMFEAEKYEVAEKPLWAALPSVTGTGKPAAAPIHDFSGIAEDPEPYNFAPVTAYQFKKLFSDNGWTILEKNSPCPSPSEVDPARLWVEAGDIDHEGHARGWKLAKQIDASLGEIRDRVISLLAAGWEKVRIVTDHGWLLLPGGLPKIDLPSALADTKWGRCASVKPGASTDERLYPWFWNPNHFFALADGICCYRKGEEYAHGGLSLQESLVLELLVTSGEAKTSGASVEITDLVWKFQRCNVAVDGQFEGLSVDLRTQPGNPESSVIMSAKPLKENGTASVVVDNEDLEGKEATLVLLDDEGKLVAQVATVIGGDTHG